MTKRKMMPRRARNEGNIRKRTDGRYEVRVVDPLSGKRQSIFAKSEAEAVERLKGAHGKSARGEAVIDSRMTCGTYFTAWVQANKDVRPSTKWRYETLLRRHVTAHIGRVKLAQLSPLHLRTLYASLMEGEAPLSARTVGHVHRVIQVALARAVEDNLIGRNVAAAVKPPAVPSTEMTTLGPEQVKRLIAESEQSRIGAIFVVAATTGMREGELLGLTWGDVDLAGGTVRVRRTLAKIRQGEPVYQEPKTASARRTVSLSNTAIEALKAHRKRQVAERLEAKLWEDRDLVFANKIGREYHAGHFLRDEWTPMRTAAELPDDFKFHGLRHTAASLALSAGVPLTTVSAMLGHASPKVTLGIYGHCVPGTQDLAAAAMDRLLGSG